MSENEQELDMVWKSHHALNDKLRRAEFELLVARQEIERQRHEINYLRTGLELYARSGSWIKTDRGYAWAWDNHPRERAELYLAHATPMAENMVAGGGKKVTG